MHQVLPQRCAYSAKFPGVGRTGHTRNGRSSGEGSELGDPGSPRGQPGKGCGPNAQITGCEDWAPASGREGGERGLLLGGKPGWGGLELSRGKASSGCGQMGGRHCARGQAPEGRECRGRGSAWGERERGRASAYYGQPRFSEGPAGWAPPSKLGLLSVPQPSLPRSPQGWPLGDPDEERALGLSSSRSLRGWLKGPKAGAGLSDPPGIWRRQASPTFQKLAVGIPQKFPTDVRRAAALPGFRCPAPWPGPAPSLTRL